MKKMMFLAIMMTIAISASAMTYEQARNEALFLSDKMAYELDLTEDQYEAVYEINLDYLMSVDNGRDVTGTWWNRRNADLGLVLSAAQFDRYMNISYFYRPISWRAGAWVFHIHNRYTNLSYYYRPRPAVFLSYRGGHNRLHSGYYASRRPVVGPAHRPAINHRPARNVGHAPAPRTGHGNNRHGYTPARW